MLRKGDGLMAVEDGLMAVEQGSRLSNSPHEQRIAYDMVMSGVRPHLSVAMPAGSGSGAISRPGQTAATVNLSTLSPNSGKRFVQFGKKPDCSYWQCHYKSQRDERRRTVP
jgi:hypothetical protein